MTALVLKSPRRQKAASKEPFLNRRRLRYALWSALALWVTWMISVILGPVISTGHVDMAGQRIGNDLSHFYAAGLTVRTGNAEKLYDIGYQFALQAKIIGTTETGFSAFLTPPFHALTYVPLTYLSYPVAFIVLSAVGLALFWLALKLIGADMKKSLPWALSFFPVFATVSFGQNAFLSMAILAGTYALWRARKLVLAGLLLSCILYKPQLALGVAGLWTLQWRKDWRALAGLAAGAGVFSAICFVFMPEASRSYMTFSQDVLPKLVLWSEPSVWHMHTVRNFFELLVGYGMLANILAALVGLGAIAGFIRYRMAFAANPAMTYAGAIVLTMLITPHGLVYDWIVLLIPALLLWQERPADRPFLTQIYAALWIVIWFAGPLTSGQLYFSDHVLQISVPVLLVAVAKMWRHLLNPPAPESANATLDAQPAAA
ncbi:MAG TPA: glycosyltransferase family 87 protein [Actinomycetota bacterium]|nr:glycosyltransferase family 87 protein [Actinomycetota bacterium]